MSHGSIPSRIARRPLPVTALLPAWVCLIAAPAVGQATSHPDGGCSEVRFTAGRSDVHHGHSRVRPGPGGRVNESSVVPDLPGALAQAARDGAGPVMISDRTLSGDAPRVIRLTEPLVLSAGTPGHDTIDGSGWRGGVVLDTSGCRDPAIIIQGDGQATIRAVALRGAQQRAIVVKDRGQATLEQVMIEKSGGSGIVLFGQAVATLKDCTISTSRTHGLELHGQSSLSLTGCSILDSGQSGLAVLEEARVEGAGCRFDGNAEWGVLSAGRGQIRLVRTVIRGGRFANADLSGAAALNLADCVVEHASRFGIFATDDAVLTLTRTRLSENGGRGIELQDRSRLTSTDSSIEANADYGVVLFRDAQARAQRTLFAGNGAHGVSLCDRSGAEFDACTFAANRYSGVACPDARNGGWCRVTQSLFRQNGLRPIYRGPLHIDPLVPTPAGIEGPRVICMADPNAHIELFLDRVGEAARFLRALRADGEGRFEVDLREVPDGWVMTATATVSAVPGRRGSPDEGGSTSEFNVVAGSPSRSILAALAGRTGPLSDGGGKIHLDARLRRWQHGTRLVLQFDESPGATAESYLRYLTPRVAAWTLGRIAVETHVGSLGTAEPSRVIVPVKYLPSETVELQGRGGATCMRWDVEGLFQQPMTILLASAPDPRDCCPRVLAHEIGHALGLGHVRAGLLSRMQGSAPPVGEGMINDFSPSFTYYDIQALRLLYASEDGAGATLRRLAERGLLPSGPDISVAQVDLPAAQLGISTPVLRLEAVGSPNGPLRRDGD